MNSARSKAARCAWLRGGARIGNTLSRQTLDGDARYYLRLGGTGLLAMRARGFKSIGDYPDYTFFGGNAEMHGYSYLQFTGQNAWYTNAELRFPLIEAMLTPIGVLGGVRGMAFANIGAASFDDSPNCAQTASCFNFSTSKPLTYTPVIGYNVNQVAGNVHAHLWATGGRHRFPSREWPCVVRSGLETFALGFPIHFDWAWRTLFNKDWEDAIFASAGGHSEFRKPRFSVSIGYDFNEIRSAEFGVRSEGPHSGYSAPRSAFRVQLRTPTSEFGVQLRTPHSALRTPHSALRIYFW